SERSQRAAQRRSESFLKRRTDPPAGQACRPPGRKRGWRIECEISALHRTSSDTPGAAIWAEKSILEDDVLRAQVICPIPIRQGHGRIDCLQILLEPQQVIAMPRAEAGIRMPHVDDGPARHGYAEDVVMQRYVLIPDVDSLGRWIAGIGDRVFQ